MILYEKGSTTTNASGTTFTLQDTSNERKLSFKKYYGDTQQSGTPTPSSPQPINVVTGGNTISVVGKNLFSGFIKGYGLNATNGLIASSATSAISEAIPVDFDTYSSYYIKGLTNTISSLIAGYNENFEFIGRTGGTTRTSTEIKPSNMTSGTPQGTGKIKYIIVTQYKTGSQTGTIDDIDNLQVMLNTGSTPLTYEAYIGQKYEVNLGKNLLSLTDGTYSHNSVTAVVSNGVMTISGTANGTSVFDVPLQTPILASSGRLMKSLNATGTYAGLQTSLRASNGTTSVGLWTTDALSKDEILTGDAYKFRIQVNSGISVDCTIKPQVEHGITITPFSPYKTPIELNKIGTYQDTIFKSSGKNLFDIEQITTTNTTNWTLTKTINAITIKHNNSYSTGSPNIDLGTLKSGSYTLSYNSTNSKKMSLYINGTYNKQLTNGETFLANGTDNYKMYFQVGDNETQTFSEIMLVEGTTTQPYEPYGTDYYIKKEIGKVVLDGSENWVSGAYGTNSWVLSNAISVAFDTNELQIMTRKFKGIKHSDRNTNDNVIYTSSNTQFWLRNTPYTTKADTQSGMSGEAIYYVLNTPTYTKVTGELLEQIEALENATTYDNVTNILQSNTDLPLYVDLEYLKPLDFSRNGLGYLPNPISAYVTDEINGEYSLTFEYPIQDAMANEIVEDRIVKCKVADGTNQCFVIKKIQKNFDKMSVYCTHLFYMLYDDFLEDTYPQNLSPKPFLDHILSRANYQLPFVANSDIATSKSARYVRKNVVEAILGNINNSMYNLWGMELKRDNWNIGLKARLGADKGEKLIFGKNITGVDVSVDTTGIYTRIMPIGFDGLLLPEKYIDAPNINEYPYPRICLYEFPDIRYDSDLEDTEAYHTLDEAYQALRDAVQELFDKGINKPVINIKVDWLELSKTEEFKQYSALERVDLGDTLTSNLFGMDYETRVIKTIYNPLNDRVEQFEIGTARPSITSEMNQLDFDVINLPSSMLNEAQANATQLITQAMGGYVYKTNSELYIMDNPDPAQAVKVWRWNINGLGYSSTGINGTYGIAMTMDGSIVADFITTGQLSANVISASTIIGVINGNTSQLKLDADQIDLTATDVLNILSGNSLNLTSKNITIDSTNFSVDANGNMSCNNATINGGSIDVIDNGTQQENDSHIIIQSADGKKKNFLTSNVVDLMQVDTVGNVQYLTRAVYYPGYSIIARENGDYSYEHRTVQDYNNLYTYLHENGHTYNNIYGSQVIRTQYDGNVTFDVDVETGKVTTPGNISGVIKVTSSNGDSSSTEYNKWHHIGKIKFDSHRQGEFAFLKIYLGDGNNGAVNQQAYIDLFMQLGWTGSDNGRPGCNAVLHPMFTNFRTYNTYVKVMAANGSNTEYDIYLLTTEQFVVPNISADISTNATFTSYDEYINSTPSGDECNLTLSIAYDDFIDYGTFTATKTGGNANITDTEYWIRGNAIQLLIKFNTSGGSTAVGSNVWEGYISDVPVPFVMATGCSYYGATGYIAAYQTDGTLAIRAIGSQSQQNNNEHAISLVYFR